MPPKCECKSPKLGRWYGYNYLCENCEGVIDEECSLYPEREKYLRKLFRKDLEHIKNKKPTP